MNKGSTKVMISMNTVRAVLEHDSLLNVKLRTLTNQHQSNVGTKTLPNFSCLLCQTQSIHKIGKQAVNVKNLKCEIRAMEYTFK